MSLRSRRTGTTSVTGLGGLMKTAPLLAVLFFVPAMNLSGIPPMSGLIPHPWPATSPDQTSRTWAPAAGGGGPPGGRRAARAPPGGGPARSPK
jgi:hypothetical protein